MNLVEIFYLLHLLYMLLKIIYYINAIANIQIKSKPVNLVDK